MARRVCWLVLFATAPASVAYAMATARKLREDAHHRILARHGLTTDDYSRLVECQGGACAICRRPEKAIRLGKTMRLAVDHDHESGRVRGLLCMRCNTDLGIFERVLANPAFAAYLERARATKEA